MSVGLTDENTRKDGFGGQFHGMRHNGDFVDLLVQLSGPAEELGVRGARVRVSQAPRPLRPRPAAPPDTPRAPCPEPHAAVN